MRTKGNAAAGDAELTAEEQAALQAQRELPEPPAQETPQEAPETPQEGATAPEGGEGEQTDPQADKRPQMVPHAALHEERERRKEAERVAAENQRKWEERFNQLLQRVPQPQQPQAPEQPAIPEFQADPAGHIVGTMQQQGASIAQINHALQSLAAQQQQAHAVGAIQQRALALESEFRGNTPDYDAAVTHLRDFRNKQLEALGWSDPARRQAQIMQEALGIAHEAMSNGRNPAEVLYQMARVSGYAPSTPAAQASAAGNGAAAQPDPAAKIETVRRGQEQARGLSGVRGSGPSPLSIDKIMEMSDDELLKMAQNPSPEFKRFLGA